MSPDAKQTCREARWFLEGDVPDVLRPKGRPKRRVDAYNVETLKPWLALKRRGRSSLAERKVRVGRVELVVLADVGGFAETWVKTRLDHERPRGAWLEVRKHWWPSGEVEIGYFEVEGCWGWTVCVDVTRAATPNGRALLGAWRAELSRRGQPSSYPAWIGQRFGPSPTAACANELSRARRDSLQHPSSAT